MGAPAGVAGGLGKTVVLINVTNDIKDPMYEYTLAFLPLRERDDERVWKREKVAKGTRVT